MQHQSTIRRLPLRTVPARAGTRFPTTVNQETPLRDLPVAETLYSRYNGGIVPAHTLTLVMAAMRDAGAVVTSYLDARGELTARVLWPSSVTLTKECHITAWCYCTLRRGWKSFRLDRIQTIHPLTTPDDAEDDAAAPIPIAPRPSRDAQPLAPTA